MDTRRLFTRTASICFFLELAVFLLLSACGQTLLPTPPPTPFTVTNSPLELPTDTPIVGLPILSIPTPTCTDDLRFVADVTIPDNTVVAAGSLLDKQWQVKNNGDCNWDVHYRLRLVTGDALVALPEQALFPARAGTEAILRILFTAPQQEGDYVSEWQAFDPNGIQFGESFVIKITVHP